MSRRLFLALVVIGCTPSPAPTPSRAATSPTANANAGSDPASDPIADCKTAIDDYLATRAALSHCERDSDCAEIWPGLCPHGPFYIHREADIDPVQSLARRIEAHCSVPDCEPPIELGIARCEEGKCVTGRTAPTSGKTSCWDFRESHLEPAGATQGRTVARIVGTTAHIVIAPAEAGRLALRVQWPRDCTDCKLVVSEHNSGMARLLDTTPSSSTDIERNGTAMREDTIELPVTPGPYHMVGTAASPVDFHVHADLRRSDGAPGRVTRHGVGWTRMCED